jgi:PTH1 family peptidyl-tRNA hydrolase
MIRLFVGLGNPGFEYEQTRHNAGFWWIDQLARQWRVTLQPERSYFGLVARANLPGGPVWLLQPQTYMNLSGKAVAALARFYKIAPDEILAVHDELDLPPGQMKLKQGGSAAGHNGLKDMQAQLGSSDFWRLRLGIGHPGARGEVASYVLGRPIIDDRIAIDLCIERSLKAVDQFTSGDMSKALQLIHAGPQRPKPPRKPAAPDAAAAAAPIDKPPQP